MTPRLRSRQDLLSWLGNNAPNSIVDTAIIRGECIVWGLFEGGWVVEVRYHNKSHVIGIKPEGIEGTLICGMMSRIPFKDYIGGDSPLTRGDYPSEAGHRKEHEDV